MAKNTKIKVIKKDDQTARSVPVKKESDTKKTAARDMVATVATWVSDFQSRKRVETHLAFEKLFSGSPRPNET